MTIGVGSMSAIAGVVQAIAVVMIKDIISHDLGRAVGTVCLCHSSRPLLTSPA